MVNHIPFEKWLEFVNDELNESDRRKCEDHLYTCDQCLQLYVQAIDYIEESIPLLRDATFTDDIIEHIETRPIRQTNEDQIYKRKIVNYFVAAAMTIILMGSGAFTQLLDTVNRIDVDHQEKTSFIRNLMNSSTSIIEELKDNSKGD